MAPAGEMVLGLPDVRLRPFVDRYVGYRERADVRRESAGVFVVLILGWGAPLDVTDPRSAERGATKVDSFVAGTFDGWCTTRTMGVGEGVELLLAPLTARRLLGLPLSELTNRAVGVGQLPGRWLDRLRGRLAEAAGWPERFALLDWVLAGRLASSPPVDARLDWAWRWLVASGGQEGVWGCSPTNWVGADGTSRPGSGRTSGCRPRWSPGCCASSRRARRWPTVA
ncbi:hypothetical protein ACLQ28_27390 [Micromonospora sp. DT201]|uniref:hypothetical protein n=1 Tax=Micromonospora sp. DT201 TaxID=3393442 RepID=UPI003CF0A8D0